MLASFLHSLRDTRLGFGKLAVGLVLLAMSVGSHSPGRAHANDLLPSPVTLLNTKLSNSEEKHAGHETLPIPEGVDLKGWEHLFSLFVREGLDPNSVASLLSDDRMPKRTTMYFSLNPRESKYLYRKHNSARARRSAIRFYEKHYRYFEEAYAEFGVPKSIILAIIQVETNCGSYTGRSQTFHGLARLSTARDPSNIKANFEMAKVKNSSTTLAQVIARAKWLEQEFLPHSIATIKLSKRMGIHPLELRGSAAGAIGIPQFLPGNIDRFGHDGNGDKIIDLFEPADAIPSVAKYLKHHGWSSPTAMEEHEQRKVIWAYNRSDSYIDTVLKMSSALDKGILSSDKEIEKSFEELL